MNPRTPPEKKHRPKRRRLSGWTARLLTGVTLLAALAGMSALYSMAQFSRIPARTYGNVVAISIPPGSGLSAIAHRLHQQGLVRSSFRFKLMVRMAKKEGALKAGEYRLSAAMTPSEILEILYQGQVRRYRLTIPEGLNVDEIARRIENAGLAGANDILCLAEDSDFCRQLHIPADHLEGYLFPDTYFFEKPVSPATILTTMVRRFYQVFSPEWQKAAQEQGMSLHEVVTLASIVEKETGQARERPLIASVFHNRLTRNMRLQSDPTVIYGIKNFDGNITRQHLREHTPYNTYRIKGLPPGPIASPGKAAIEAVLFPADTDHLYFVSKNDGSHHFSKTLAQHNRAVKRYQLNQ